MLKKLLFNKITTGIHRFYLSINLKMTEFALTQNDKCLVLAPHADDESIGCGGIMSLYPQNFDAVCLTDGRKGIKSLPIEECIKVRKEEFFKAMQKAGIRSFEIFDIEDKHLIENYEKFRHLNIQDYDFIFVPNLLDQHPDHKSVSLLLNRLLKEQKHKSTLKIAFYEVWSTLALPNVFVDITEVATKKRELINTHRSQVEAKNYTDKALALNAYRGLLRDKDFAEVFCMVDEKTFEKMCQNCI